MASLERDRKRLEPSDLDRERGEPLAHREAMSLVSTGSSSSLLSGYEDLGASGEAPAVAETTDSASGTAAGATGSADDVTSLAGTDADASGTDTASVTDADRSESFHQSDSAVSET